MDRFSDLRVLRWSDRILPAINGDVRNVYNYNPNRVNPTRLGPVRANLDLTNLCSHNCPWCEPLQYREETIRDQRHTLTRFVAMEVIRDLADMDCKTVVFSGGGEPTLHPDFGEILEFATENGLRTSIVTHGGLMHKMMPQLAKANHIRISLDASNVEEHMEMHGSKPGEFTRVLENIKRLCACRFDAQWPEVGVAYTVADCNSSRASFQRVLDLASSMGVDFVHFRPLSEPEPSRFTGHWGQICEDIERMALAVRTVQVFPVSKRHRDVFTQREFDNCYSARTTGVIGANGDVVACCDRRDIVFGNVYKERFRDIWMGETHLKKSAEITPKLCGLCLQCGYNRGVQKYIVENQALPELV